MREENPGILIKKYFIMSFALLFCIICVYQAIISIYTHSEHRNVETINMAGRQRMLSQRIGTDLLLSLIASRAENRKQYINLVINDTEVLIKNHKFLEKNASKLPFHENNSQCKKNFIAIKEPLTQITLIAKNISKLEKNTPFTQYEYNQALQLINNYSISEKKFIELMDDIVKCYEIDSQDYIAILEKLSWFGAGFILIAMFVNGRFVVYKSIHEVNAQFLKIKNHEEFQKTILSSSLDGIISINHLGCITLMNKPATNFFLGSEDDYLRKNISTIIPDFNFNLLKLITHNYTIELQGRKKGGGVFPILINISKIETNHQQGWVIFIKDLTFKKQIQSELNEAKQKLLDAVAENNYKSQFLTDISHDLKTPLNSIIGFTQLLQMDKDALFLPEKYEYIDYIEKASAHLLTLINGILDLAKSENSKQSLSLEMIDIAKIVKEVLILTYSLSYKKHITIYNNIQDNNYIIADVIYTKQVLLNLVSNAIKYNKEHGIIILRAENIQNRFLKISVTDSGLGIKKDKLSQLFSPFERLGAENTDIEGMGIGLTITKRLVEAMHGNIGVVSEENKGSTFWIELPSAELD